VLSNPALEPHNGELLAEEAEKIFPAQRLDTIMAKAQSLRESTTIHSHRSPFRRGSPLAPSESNSRQYVDHVRGQHQGEHHAARSLLQSSKSVPPEHKIPKTISPKLIGLQYHENDEGTSGSSQHAVGLSDSYSLFEENAIGDLRKRTPQPGEHRAERNPEHAFPLGGDLTDFMRPLERQRLSQEQRVQNMRQYQSGEHKTSGAVAPTNSRSEQIQFPGSDGHDRFGYNFSVAPNDSPTKDQPISDGRGQSRLGDRTHSNQDLELLWSSSAIDNTAGDEIDASRGMVTMSQDTTPRNIYGAQARASRGSGDSYGFPTIHSRSSSISQTIHTETLSRPGPLLTCPTCQKTVKTRSELK
jgi:hypothetical protein